MTRALLAVNNVPTQTNAKCATMQLHYGITQPVMCIVHQLGDIILQLDVLQYALLVII